MLKRAGLVVAHQGRVTGHIGSKNGSEPAFHGLSPSPRRLTTKDRRIYAVGMVVECRLLANPRLSERQLPRSA
jgi:hypothetical protein